jgi:hypothetical protein
LKSLGETSFAPLEGGPQIWHIAEGRGLNEDIILGGIKRPVGTGVKVERIYCRVG